MNNSRNMKEKPILLASWIMCPNGTMLPSFYVHDYRTHETVDTWKQISDDNGIIKTVPDETRYSMIDGGIDYLKRGGEYTEMSIYSNDPYEVIRRFLCRGGRGKDSTEYLTWTPLFRINDEWLKALIGYVTEDNIYLEYYKKEIEYRKEHKIIVK